MRREHWRGIIEAYRHLLPIDPHTPVITLLEGNTPLVASRTVGSRIKRNVWFKVEGANPTGSFKDRGMTVAVSRAMQASSRGVICASTGNTAASAAAYAARAGLPCVVIVPAGGVAAGKLVQTLAHGATVVTVDGTFDQAGALARKAAAQFDLTSVNSINPDRIHGQQTVAWEICDTMGEAPDLVVLPVGNAGNITALWQGFQAYHARDVIHRLPRLIGMQAVGAAPLVEGRVIPEPRTLASAIRIGNPASWQKAVDAAKASGGVFHAVDDSEILDAQRLLAEEEGVFAEPASAAGLAGVMRLWAMNRLPPGEIVVVVLTGHGLKDADAWSARLPLPARVPPTSEAVAAAIEQAGHSERGR